MGGTPFLVKKLGFDPVGNRLSLTVDAAASSGVDEAIAYAYDPLNRVASVTNRGRKTTFAYEPGGLPDVVTYAFDGTNRLAGVSSSSTVVTYGYDPDGKEVKQVANGQVTWFAFDGLSAVMELGADKKPTAVLVPGVSKTRLDLHEPLTEFYLHDGLGSVVQLTDVLGNLTQEYLYDPFGATKNVRRDPFNRYRFVSLAQDDLTGLTYMNARWYDPQSGRFMSRDRLRLATADSSGELDRFLYVGQNPTNLTDVPGLYRRLNRGECEQLAQEIQALNRRRAQREAEQTAAGGEKSPEGPPHRKAISQLEANIAKKQATYDRDCKDDGPSGGAAAAQPQAAPSAPAPTEDQGKAAELGGLAAIAAAAAAAAEEILELLRELAPAL